MLSLITTSRRDGGWKAEICRSIQYAVPICDTKSSTSTVALVHNLQFSTISMYWISLYAIFHHWQLAPHLQSVFLSPCFWSPGHESFVGRMCQASFWSIQALWIHRNNRGFCLICNMHLLWLWPQTLPNECTAMARIPLLHARVLLQFALANKRTNQCIGIGFLTFPCDCIRAAWTDAQIPAYWMQITMLIVLESRENCSHSVCGEMNNVVKHRQIVPFDSFGERLISGSEPCTIWCRKRYLWILRNVLNCRNSNSLHINWHKWMFREKKNFPSFRLLLLLTMRLFLISI